MSVKPRLLWSWQDPKTTEARGVLNVFFVVVGSTTNYGSTKEVGLEAPVFVRGKRGE